MDFYWESISDVLIMDTQKEVAIDDAKSKKDDDFRSPVNSTANKTTTSDKDMDETPTSLRRRVIVDFSNIREELNPPSRKGGDGKSIMRIPFLPVVIRTDNIETHNNLTHHPSTKEKEPSPLDTVSQHQLPALIDSSTENDTISSTSSLESQMDTCDATSDQFSLLLFPYPPCDECCADATISLGSDDSSSEGETTAFSGGESEWIFGSLAPHTTLLQGATASITGLDTEDEITDDDKTNTITYLPFSSFGIIDMPSPSDAGHNFSKQPAATHRLSFRKVFFSVLLALALVCLAGKCQHEVQQLFPPHMTQLSDICSHVHQRPPSPMRSVGLAYLDRKYGCPAAAPSTAARLLFARPVTDWARTMMTNILSWAETSSGFHIVNDSAKEMLLRWQLLDPAANDDRVITNVRADFLRYLLDPQSGPLVDGLSALRQGFKQPLTIMTAFDAEAPESS